VTKYVEFHLGRTIALSALSELLTDISIDRFAGFVRVIEAGEGRFVLSFPRPDGAPVALFSLIREKPGQLYAERSLAFLGDWVLESYACAIVSRTGALVSTEERESLHTLAAAALPTFADWLLSKPELSDCAEETFTRYLPVIPLPLRGIVSFKSGNPR
jgi:hypothetical protein